MVAFGRVPATTEALVFIDKAVPPVGMIDEMSRQRRRHCNVAAAATHAQPRVSGLGAGMLTREFSRERVCW